MYNAIQILSITFLILPKIKQCSKLYLIKNYIMPLYDRRGVSGFKFIMFFFLISVVSIISLNIHLINLVYFININSKK